MEIRFSEDIIKELIDERKEAIEDYIELQEWFKELAIKGLCKHFMIQYLNDELDIDSMSEEQMKRLDNCKDEETREHLSKDLPRKDRSYDLFYITPYSIGDEINRKDVTAEQLDTYIIKEINTRIKTRIDLYSNMIKNV